MPATCSAFVAVAAELCASAGRLTLPFMRKECQCIDEGKLVVAEWLERVGTMEQSA